ncbi:MAG: hypothetical protein ACP5VQ_06020 [Phycisphaerae bacterium]
MTPSAIFKKNNTRIEIECQLAYDALTESGTPVFIGKPQTKVALVGGYCQTVQECSLH